MDSSKKSTPQPPSSESVDPARPDRGSVEPDALGPDTLDPHASVCVFRHVALLQMPGPCRGPLHHLGDLLFDWSLETFGIADEEPDSEAIAARRLEALAEDLHVVSNQLAALSLEPEGSEVGPKEREMCEQAGHLAPAVLHLARRLRQAADHTPR